MKRITLLLLILIGTLSAQAIGFEGTTLKSGTDYYLFNVYQQKFLSYGNAWGTQVSLDNKNPLLCTVTASSGGYIVNTHYSLTSQAYNAAIDNYVYVADGIPVVNANYGSSDNIFTKRTPQVFTFKKVDEGYNLTFSSGGYTKALIFDAGTACTVDTLSKGYNADKAIWKLISTDEYNAYKAKKRFTVAALNVDGMPKSINFLGITINLNPDAKESAGATAIGHKLKTMGWDVIGVSEDFNYHSDIWNEAWNNGTDDANGESYNATTHRGTISVGNASLTNYTSKKPLFDTDGLCLFFKRNSVDQGTLESSESWTAWTTHNGYTDSGADGLIKKGYRYYTVRLADATEVDLYILHMDAEDNAEDNAAREVQITQLAEAIKASNNGRPIIVMGDTNCRYTRDRLKELFIDALNSDSRFTVKDAWVEFARDGLYPNYGTNAIMTSEQGFRKGEVVDKVFYINNTASSLRIRPVRFTQDISFINDAGEPLADHWPMVTEFEYYTYDPSQDVEEDTPTGKFNGTYYLRNRQTKYFLKAGGWWGTHAVQGTYGKPITLTQLPSGKYDLSGVTQGDPYMDGNSDPWTLTESGKYCVFSYTDNGVKKALSGNDATTFPAKPGPNKRYVTCATYSLYDNYQKWELLTEDDLYNEALSATPAKPYDCTYKLKGANFDRNDSGVSAWNSNIASSAKRLSCNLSDGVTGNAFDNPCAEVFVSSYSGWSSPATTWEISQPVSGLPNGTYRVSCQAFQRISNSNTTTADINIYARNGNVEQKVPVPLMYAEKKVTSSSFGGTTLDGGYYYPNSMAEASLYFNAGYYLTSLEVNVTDGNLTIAIAKTSDTGNSNSAWTCFDNFQLHFLGDLRGDANGDGLVNMADLTALINHLLLNTPISSVRADVDNNGSINLQDVQTLVQTILNK